MVGRRLPCSVQQFHPAELVERDAAPVIRGAHRFQATLAFSAVLIAKHPELSSLVSSQPVRTKQAMAIVVNGRDWPPVLHGPCAQSR